MNKNTLRRTLVATAVGAAAAFTGIAWSTDAHADADPSIGCEKIRWGFLGSQRRTMSGSTTPLPPLVSTPTEARNMRWAALASTAASTVAAADTGGEPVPFRSVYRLAQSARRC